jgi:hypothetical protein
MYSLDIDIKYYELLSGFNSHSSKGIILITIETNKSSRFYKYESSQEIFSSDISRGEMNKSDRKEMKISMLDKYVKDELKTIEERLVNIILISLFEYCYSNLLF